MSAGGRQGGRGRDAVFDFWYNFVFARRQVIEMENRPADTVDLNPDFGKRFEAFVRSEFSGTVPSLPSSCIS